MMKKTDLRLIFPLYFQRFGEKTHKNHLFSPVWDGHVTKMNFFLLPLKYHIYVVTLEKNLGYSDFLPHFMNFLKKITFHFLSIFFNILEN